MATTAFDATQWPSISIPSDIKQLMSLLFFLVESKDSTVGDQLVNDVFTPDGKFITPHSNATGSAGRVFPHIITQISFYFA